MGYILRRGIQATFGAPAPQYSILTLQGDGIWTWFSDPRAVYYNGATYFCYVTSAGDCKIGKYVHATGVTTAFTLRAGLQVDDHAVPSMHVLSDGRLATFYCAHNDGTAMRYRISTNVEDISAWATETWPSGTTLPVTYTNPRRLSADPNKLWLFYRSGSGGGGGRLAYKTATDPGLTGWVAQQDLWEGGANTPYYKMIDNGVDRIDFVATNLHPVQGASSVYHFYMKLTGTTPHWYKSDGTEIVTALPFNASVVTLVSSGASVKRWIWDIVIAADGNPRILGTRYPGNDGSDIRYMEWRWNGSAWTETEITDAGPGLYNPEVFYAPGICYDGNNPDRVFLSKAVGSARELSEWQTTDGGAIYSKIRDITTGSALGTVNGRPYSPKGHPSDLPVMWWSGSYTTFVNYSAAVKASLIT